MTSNRKPGQVYTAHELMRSTLTQFVQEIRGTRIYSHAIRQMAGAYVIITPLGNWETYETFQDAKRAVVLR